MNYKVKAPDRIFRVNNGESILTLRVHKKQLIHVALKLAFSLFFTALVLFLILTYRADSPLFWPLAKSSVILGLVFFTASKTNSILNQSVNINP